MFGARITLFRVFGFEIRIDASWIIIALLVTWSLADAVFPMQFPGLLRQTYWWMGVTGAVAFFGSIVVHELCHSIVANHYKLPMKGITLFIFGGVAEMGGEPQSPKVEFLMAIAGPIASIAIGFAFYAGARATLNGPLPVHGVFAYLAWINWMLAGFNLIPAFPLDGGRVLRSILWHFKHSLIRATTVASRIGSAFGMLLMIWGIYELFAGYFVSAIWYFLIGSFLRGASQASLEQVLLRSVLAGEPVRRFMHPNPVAVSPDMSIHQFVDDYLYHYDLRVYPVVSGTEDLVGCVTPSDVRAVPREEWDQHSVAELARPCTAADTVSPDTDALTALARIRDTGGKELLVTERNRLLAIVTARDFLNYLAARLKFEGGTSALSAPPRI